MGEEFLLFSSAKTVIPHYKLAKNKQQKKTKLKIIIIVQRALCHNNCFLLIGDADKAMRQHRVHWRGGWGISAGILVHPIRERIYGYGSKGCTEWVL